MQEVQGFHLISFSNKSVDHILDKRAASRKRKRGTCFPFSKKRGNFFHFQESLFFHASLILMH